MLLGSLACCPSSFLYTLPWSLDRIPQGMPSHTPPGYVPLHSAARPGIGSLIPLGRQVEVGAFRGGGRRGGGGGWRGASSRMRATSLNPYSSSSSASYQNSLATLDTSTPSFGGRTPFRGVRRPPFSTFQPYPDMPTLDNPYGDAMLEDIGPLTECCPCPPPPPQVIYVSGSQAQSGCLPALLNEMESYGAYGNRDFAYHPPTRWRLR